MNLARTLFIWRTCLVRALHRHGFGVQSPSDYELVRDVLFEKLHYYAYKDLGLSTESLRQLWRICNHFHDVIVINETGDVASSKYEQAIASKATAIVVENINNANAPLWNKILADPCAILTFDMRKRGLIVNAPKRIKQNYLL